MDELSEYLDYLLNKKNKEFDQFKPFESVELSNFVFYPGRYEVWEKGAVTGSGKYDSPIHFNVSKSNPNKVSVHLSDNTLSNFILQDFQFSICFTQKDRVQLAEIPSALSTDSNGLNALRLLVGETIERKIFLPNEPYCSGIFFIEEKLSKLNFSFNSPNKLIEFHD